MATPIQAAFPVIPAIATGLSAGVACALYGMLSPTSRLFAPVILRGPRTGNRVALTFDDGPYPPGTGPVLDILAEHGIRATFFFIGRNAAKHSEFVHRTHAEGHLIGNHSFDHSRWGIMRRCWYWTEQFQKTNSALVAAGGPPHTEFFRPPMGFKTWRMALAAKNENLKIIAWSLRGFDGVATTPDAIIQRILPRASAGDIIALHDGIEPGKPRDPAATIAALPALIRGLKDRGLQPVRLDELLGHSGPQARKA